MIANCCGSGKFNAREIEVSILGNDEPIATFPAKLNPATIFMTMQQNI